MVRLTSRVVSFSTELYCRSVTRLVANRVTSNVVCEVGVLFRTTEDLTYHGFEGYDGCSSHLGSTQVDAEDRRPSASET